MNKSLVILFILSLFVTAVSFAQEDTLSLEVDDNIKLKTKKVKEVPDYDPLAPARAAFYSAVLPGLGQAYNKDYWKIPVAYAGLAIPIYFYINNDKEYNRFRDAYKRRLAGFEDDEFFGQVNDDGLIEAQRFYQRNKEISLLVTAAIYVINIVDANVSAHLRQFNVSDDLSLQPDFQFDEFSGKTHYVMSLNYKF